MQTLIFESNRTNEVLRILKEHNIEGVDDINKSSCAFNIENGRIVSFIGGPLTKFITSDHLICYSGIIEYEDFIKNPGLINGCKKPPVLVKCLQTSTSTFHDVESPISRPYKLIPTEAKFGIKDGLKKFDLILGINQFGSTSVWLGYWNDGV